MLTGAVVVDGAAVEPAVPEPAVEPAVPEPAVEEVPVEPVGVWLVVPVVDGLVVPVVDGLVVPVVDGLVVAVLDEPVVPMLDEPVVPAGGVDDVTVAAPELAAAAACDAANAFRNACAFGGLIECTARPTAPGDEAFTNASD